MGYPLRLPPLVALPIMLALLGSTALAAECPAPEALAPALQDAAADGASIVQGIADALDLEEGFTRIDFSGRIDEQGRLHPESDLYGLPRHAQEIVVRGLRRVAFASAQRDGEPVTVWSNFTLLIQRQGDTRRAALLPYTMEDFSQLSHRIVGAQRLQHVRRPVPGEPHFLRARTTVGADGVAARFDAERTHGDADAIARIMRYLVDACFIPASRDGEAVQAPYWEEFD